MYSRYLSDFDCLRSVAAIRQRLYYDSKHITKTPGANTAQIATTPKERRTVPIQVDYSTDESVIIAIQNEPKFISVITNCRKQKDMLAYIFVESEYRYITCVIKNPEGYPLMITRIPITKKVAYAKETNSVYDFPIADVLNRDVKPTKTSSYTMLFKHSGQSVQFIYDIYNGSTEPNHYVVDAVSVHDRNIVDSLFRTDDVGFVSDMGLSDQNASLLTFNNMMIHILMEVAPQNAIVFQTKTHTRARNTFKLTPTKLSYVYSTNTRTEETPICTAADSIYWNNIDGSEVTYEMKPFESMFKMNHTKNASQNDRVYYLFTSLIVSYDSVAPRESRMFIKLITSLEIQPGTHIDTLMKVFSHDYQIIEAYMCTKTIDTTE